MASQRVYRWTTLTVAIIGVLVALGAWLFPVQVTREPLSTLGDNPFMTGVGVDRPGVVPPADTGGAFAGDTPGLYGGTRNVAACDPQQMVAFLQQHADKAAAWASVLGIHPDMIADYVGRLTPVILRSDTFVTNHGFSGGKATSLSAVLQAGTAVLVDSRGIPVTKCFCGNPLTAPSGRLVRMYAGPSWPGFSRDRITVISAAKTDITHFTLVDLQTNKAFDRPSGTVGDQDQDSSAQAGSGSGSDSASVAGSWRNGNGSAIMNADSNGDRTEFHWILLDNPNDPGLRTFKKGPRPEVCTTSTSSIRIGGKAQLSCVNSDGGNVSLVLTVDDKDRISISTDNYFFFPLSGDYLRCPGPDACRP